MLLLLIVASAIFICAVVPCVLFCVNLGRYLPPGSGAATTTERVAVLIPARNEERNIAACVESVLASDHSALEVLVLDDASTDRTDEIVLALAARDPRVRLMNGGPLPAGWNGKQHACWLLAQQADAPLLLFLDADVRLAPDAVSRCAAQIRRSQLEHFPYSWVSRKWRAVAFSLEKTPTDIETSLYTHRRNALALLSGFPRQITVGFTERLLLPLIHFVLLGFLPMGAMRRSTKPAYAAGCGQFFLADREAYFASGGHAAIRTTRHDGLLLPKNFRRHGLRTDIFDLTALASVRMYESPRAVWMGLAKNATEGLAAPARIVPLSLILVLGQVMPTVAAVLWVAFYISARVVGATFDEPLKAALISVMLTLALIASYLPRLLAVRRFRQPLRSPLLHPLGILVLLAIQWYALGKQLARSPIAWRDRA